MTNEGVSRRRSGLMNRLNRLVYALLLWLSPQVPALAEDTTMALDAPLSQRVHIALQVMTSDTQGSVSVDHAELRLHDARIAPSFSTLAQKLSARSWTYSDEWRRARGGVGLDIDIAEAGNLHLNLVPARENAERGVRWRLASDGRVTDARLWSLGGSVDVVRMIDVRPRESGIRSDQRLELSPQLVLDLDQLVEAPGSAQLTLQQSYWREASSRRAIPERVWQLSLRWRF